MTKRVNDDFYVVAKVSVASLDIQHQIARVLIHANEASESQPRVIPWKVT